jgi:hypothetical protein
MIRLLESDSCEGGKRSSRPSILVLNQEKITFRKELSNKKTIRKILKEEKNFIQFHGMLIEVWENIILHLDIKEILKLSSISREAFYMFHSNNSEVDHLWKSLLERDYQIVNKYKEKNFKETFKKRFRLNCIVESNTPLKSFQFIFIDSKEHFLNSMFKEYFNKLDSMDHSFQKRIILNEDVYQLDIFNISSHLTSNLFDMMVRSGNGFIISFELNDWTSFENVKVYHELIRKSVQDFDCDLPCLIVGLGGNDSDRLIPEIDILKMAKSLNCSYQRIVEKNKGAVEHIFMEMLNIISNLSNPFNIQFPDLPWMNHQAMHHPLEHFMMESDEFKMKCEIN